MNTPTLIITPEQLDIVRAILQRHVPDREVRAFGSRVKGTMKKFSDLDLAILGEKPLPLATLAALSEEFSESDLPYKVDIVDWATTLAPFRARIEAAFVVIQRR